MARPLSRTSSNSNDGTFDLSQIFIGRQQQLDFFEIYLHRWQQLIRHGAGGDRLLVKHEGTAQAFQQAAAKPQRQQYISLHQASS